MAKILQFKNPASVPSPDDLLEQAKGHLEDVIILGWTKDAGEFYVALSDGKLSDMSYLAKAFDVHLGSLIQNGT